jgi:membrane-associated phospholipid phosphatase
MQSLDTSIFYFLFNLGQRININWLFIFFSQYLPYLILAVFLHLIYKEKENKKRIYYLGFFILLAIINRVIITETIRYFLPRPRPFVALNLNPIFVDNAPSFPSGHTTFLFSVVFCTFLISKKWGWILAGATILSVICRVIAGVHWLSDIIGGIVFSFLIFALIYYWVLPYKKIIANEIEKNS